VKMNRQWAVAILVAALMSHDKSWRDYWRGVRGVWRAIFHRRLSKVHPDIAEARMAICRECPLFFKPLMTCGSPLAEYRPELGCGCFLPALTKMRDGHCWLRENTLLENAGWPDELL